MSLINKMLKELDRRHAEQPESDGEDGGAALTQIPRPVKVSRIGSDLFWWLLAAMMLVMVGWLGWVMWQMMPKSIVTDRALQTVIRPVPPRAVEPSMQQATPGSDMQTAQAEANLQPIPPSQTQLPAVEQKPPTAQTQTTQPATLMSPPASPAPASAPARPDALKLATEIATPIPTRRSKATGETGSRVTSEPSPVVKRSGNAAPKPAIPPVAVLTPPVPAAPTKSVAAPVPQSKDAVRTPDAGLPAAVAVARPVGPLSEPRIEKRDSVVAPQTAEGLYRRGVGLINQGRVSEGTEDLRGALSMDARHDAARQTLIAMLLDQKRQDEAAVYLQQGLALNPANTAFAMLLARIMVERQDVQGALSLLQKHAAAASNNAEYRAFEAALLQRQSRHKEAAEEYAAALRISPQAGMWWVGLGISQEALEQRAEALESFQRARQTRSLNADVLAYVDQRVKQLQ